MVELHAIRAWNNTHDPCPHGLVIVLPQSAKDMALGPVKAIIVRIRLDTGGSGNRHKHVLVRGQSRPVASHENECNPPVTHKFRTSKHRILRAKHDQ